MYSTPVLLSGNGVFSDKLDSKSRGDTGLRNLVVALNNVKWDYRCRIIFEQEAFVLRPNRELICSLSPFFSL